MTKYTAHPAAELFPMMDAEQYEAFRDDIQKNGFQQDVVIYQGQILDGRNRYRAAIELDMLDDLPITETDDDTQVDPYQWVISRNLHRRHLTESQRAMVAAKLAKLTRGGDRSKASIDALKQDDAAKLLNVSPASLDRAKAVQRNGSPELIAAVEQGEIRVSKAAKVATSTPKEQQLDEAKKPTTSTTTIEEPADIELDIPSRLHSREIAKKVLYAATVIDGELESLQVLIDMAAEKEAWRPLGYASLDAWLIKEAGISQRVLDAIRQAWPEKAVKKAMRRNRKR